MLEHSPLNIKSTHWEISVGNTPAKGGLSPFHPGIPHLKGRRPRPIPQAASVPPPDLPARGNVS